MLVVGNDIPGSTSTLPPVDAGNPLVEDSDLAVDLFEDVGVDLGDSDDVHELVEHCSLHGPRHATLPNLVPDRKEVSGVTLVRDTFAWALNQFTLFGANVDSPGNFAPSEGLNDVLYTGAGGFAGVDVLDLLGDDVGVTLGLLARLSLDLDVGCDFEVLLAMAIVSAIAVLLGRALSFVGANIDVNLVDTRDLDLSEALLSSCFSHCKSR